MGKGQKVFLSPYSPLPIFPFTLLFRLSSLQSLFFRLEDLEGFEQVRHLHKTANGLRDVCQPQDDIVPRGSNKTRYKFAKASAICASALREIYQQELATRFYLFMHLFKQNVVACPDGEFPDHVNRNRT